MQWIVDGVSEGWIAFSYKFMRAALQATAGKSGKPGLYPQEFASFQRSFEERLEKGMGNTWWNLKSDAGVSRGVQGWT